MGIFSFLSRKKTPDDILEAVFKIAKKGMYNLNYSVSKEGRFEVLMFDIWLGTEIMKELRIRVDYALQQKKIEIYLKRMIYRLGLSEDRKYERVYIFREPTWKHDVTGLIHSNYPRTPQFLPAYMYLHMVAKPLIAFDDETAEKEAEKITIDELASFLGPFGDHYSWLVKKYVKLMKR